MRLPTFITACAIILPTTYGRYVLEDDYFQVNCNGSFFDKFRFWDKDDPTEGFVSYKNYTDSLEVRLIQNTSTNIIMRADSTNVTPYGRPSVRIESKKTYNGGLIAVDIDHMPGSICGAWPAFWTYGPDWPRSGEIDVIEGINEFRANRMSLHTGPRCSIRNSTAPSYTGQLLYSSCTSPENGNNGCSVGSRDATTYGDGFNAIGGGVYATEWTREHIAIWFFPRGRKCLREASGPLGTSPDPGTWGLPLSKFVLTCDIEGHFKDHSIVFDLTFCGGWANGSRWNTSVPVNSTWPPVFGGGYGRNLSCAAKTESTCEGWVRSHPGVFKEAYWSVNALRVYQKQA